MSRVTIGVAACLVALGTACDGAATQAPASVRLALSEDQCADLCANTLGAQVYRDGDVLPLGPAVVVSCGEPVVFEALPAGHQVFVRAWVARDGEVLVTGDSQVVTVAANASTDVVVEPVAVAPPLIDRIAPDPVAVAEMPVTLTIEGEGFGAGEGAYGVSLSGTPLTSTSWADTRIEAELAPGDLGDAVQVTNCGIGTSQWPLRVLARSSPGSQPVLQAPGCAGRRATGVTRRAELGDVVVAFACDDPLQGYVQRLVGDGCLTTAESVVVGGNPAAVVADPGGGGPWVAVGETVGRVAFDDEGEVSTVSLPAGHLTVALAAVDDRVYAIGDSGGATTLFRVDTGAAVAVQEVPATLHLRDLAAGAGQLLATAVDGGGAVKLVSIPVEEGVVTEWSLTDCAAPTALDATDGDWVALSCDDGAQDTLIVGFRPADGRRVSVPLVGAAAGASLAFDAMGDVLVAVTAGGASISALQLDDDTITVLATWNPASPSAGPLLRFGAGHHFLLAGTDDGALNVVAPYDEGFDCGD